MKKTFTKVIALMCAFLLTFGAGCINISPEVQKPDYDYKLWTTYNTLKVVQDPALNGNYKEMPVAINLEMSKNESEKK